MSATAIMAPTLPLFRLMPPPIGCGGGAPSAPLNVPNATRPVLAVPAAQPHGTATVGAGHASARGRGNVGRDFTQSRDPTTPWRTRPNSADWYSFAVALGLRHTAARQARTSGVFTGSA